MRLADAPEDAALDGVTIALTPALLRGDPRLQALFAPFAICTALHETSFASGISARSSRLLVAETSGDRLDEVRALVRAACPARAFEEKPTELDEVAAGTEWRERSGPWTVAAYRLFGGATSLHVTAANVDPPEARLAALHDSPLAVVAGLLEATSWVESITCSRAARTEPSWHVRAALRDLRRFEEITAAVEGAGFEDRSGRYWRERVILQSLSKDRWMAATPGIAF